MKQLNIGLIGYGFMGRTHSNAFLQAPRFFDLPLKPMLKGVAARNEDRVKAFAAGGAMPQAQSSGVPRVGDTFVFSGGPNKGKEVMVADVVLGARPELAVAKNPSTGKLEPTGQTLEVPVPVCAVFVAVR